MSSVIAIQTYDRVWIGADSAVSANIGGDTYRLHEDGKKLFHIGDKVIFCSGIMELAAAIMAEYEAAADHSLSPNCRRSLADNARNIPPSIRKLRSGAACSSN
ncbi:hypothetical protein PAPH110629_09495 [Paenibacillus phoenicis]